MVISLLLIPGLVLLAEDRPDRPDRLDRPEPVRIERHLTLMGTTLMISVEARNRTAALHASEQALKALQAAENRLSTWKKDTELSRLNEAAMDEPVKLSSELALELAQVRRWCKATGGAFDPGIGKLSEMWGLRTGGKEPTRASLDRAVGLPGLEALGIEGPTAVRRHPELTIDEGGFGKGAGLDDAVRTLKGTDATAATINLGGQVALFGDGGPVRFDVADPSDRSRTALSITIDQGALATSGNSERNLVIGERTYSHILDPRSGMPVPDFGSLTVWAGDALAADCLSTGLYVLGPERALEWAAEREGIEILVLESAGKTLKARATSGLRDRIDAGGSGVVLSFH